MSLSVKADIPTSKDLFGKKTSDLQTGIVVRKEEIAGTLKHVSDYVGYSDDEELQEGHFLALHATAKNALSIVAEIEGDSIELDSDGIVIVRITDNKSELKFTTTFRDHTEVRTFRLNTLRLGD